MTSTQRTGLQAWRASASLIACGSVTVATSTLLTTGICGGLKVMPARYSSQALRRGLEQRRVKRRADRQHDGALRTFGLGDCRAALDRRFMPRDHDLAGRIEIHRFDDFALRGFGARRAHRVIVKPEDRRHRAGAQRHRVLHGLGAQAHERQRVAQAHHARHHQRGVLAETVSGNHRRLSAARCAPCAINSITGGQHQRLRIDG